MLSKEKSDFLNRVTHK